MEERLPDRTRPELDLADPREPAKGQERQPRRRRASRNDDRERRQGQGDGTRFPSPAAAEDGDTPAAGLEAVA